MSRNEKAEDLSLELSPQRSRNVSIDFFRILAFASVVLLHVFQPSYHERTVANAAVSVLRWAVPFFFITSGYFIAFSAREFAVAATKFVARLAPVILFWVSFYTVIFGDYRDFLDPKLFLLHLISGYPGFHLWFLFALISGGLTIFLFRPMGWKVLICIGMILYIIGLCFGPYREFLRLSPIPYPYHIEFNTRWGPFEATLYLAIGYAIAVTQTRFKPFAAWGLVVVGLLSQLAEMYLIWSHGGTFGAHDYLVGTLPLGVGIFLLCNSMRLPNLLVKVSRIAPVTLGAYCIHLAFIKLIKLYIYCDTGWLTVPVALFVFAISMAFSLFISRIPVMRKVVI